MKKLVSLLLVVIVLLSILVLPVSTSALSNGDYEYKVLEGNSIEITRYIGSDTEVTIPEKIDNHTVTSIGDNAFHGCENIISVTMPHSTTNIGNYAFTGCSGLTSITIPNSVENIGVSAFSWCWSINSVTIPESVIAIEDYAFSWCRSLTSIIIPKSVINIGNCAFYICDQLADITILNPDCKISVPFVTENFSEHTIPSSTTIHGYENSTAQKYSDSFHNKFEPLKEITEPTDFTNPTIQPSMPDFTLGDADEDGVVNIFDATEIQLFLAEYKVLSDSQMLAADADRSGTVNIFDVTQIQLYLAEYITEL